MVPPAPDLVMMTRVTDSRVCLGLCIPQAQYAGDETLRGTRCRRLTASDGAIEFSVWIDQEHIRQVQTVQPSLDEVGTMTKTLELWDFGVPARSPS